MDLDSCSSISKGLFCFVPRRSCLVGSVWTRVGQETHLVLLNQGARGKNGGSLEAPRVLCLSCRLVICYSVPNNIPRASDRLLRSG